MKCYSNMNDAQKKSMLEKEYCDNLLSFAEIADKYSTYSNKVRRDAIKLKIKIRNKSDAQKIALKSGRHEHPTKGKSRPDHVKEKIGNSMMETWEGLSDKELNARKKKARDNWEKLSDDDRANIIHKANLAVRKSSDEGTKLEKFLLEKLLSDGYQVDFHKEHFLLNTKLQIDLFLPTISVAIEIDGPSHFEPIWGQDVLDKNVKYDSKKNGLILGKGLVLIRIKQNKDYSKARANLIYSKLTDQLKAIKDKYPPSGQRYIEIGD